MFDDLDLPNPLSMLPPLTPPDLDSRQNEAMMHALAIDASGVVGFIPVLGDIVADIVEDTHFSKLRALLTPAEMDRYSHFDRVGPSSLALAKTFAKKKE